MSAAVKHRVVPAEAARVRKDLSLVRSSVNRGDVLSRGDRGADVKALQRELHDAGVYSGKHSGVFDKATEQAVRSYQKARGLRADGVVGKQTLASLKANNVFVKDGFETAAGRGQSGLDILAAERRLAALGYATGAVDGKFDDKTAQAVKAFRASNDDLPDNKSALDKDVWKNLQQTYQSQVAPLQGVRRQRVVGSVKEHKRLDDATARAAAQGALKPGASGRSVRNLQAHLKAAGENPGTINASYGTRTRDAVKNFQGKNGLPATGKVDTKTWQALRDRQFAAAGKATPAQSAGERDAAVLHTERQLSTLGLNPGKVDGWYTAGTAAAVSRFQTKHGLQRTGQVDGTTLKALDKAVALKDVESDLKKLGYKPGAVDGVASSETASALRAFQKKEGLAVTGTATAQTDARLDKRVQQKEAAAKVNGPKPKGEAAKAAWYQALVKKNGGKWRTGVNEMNIVGLRGQSVDGKRNGNAFNQWNDTMAYVWKGSDGKMHVREFQATTDPGLKSGTGQDANHDGSLDLAHLRPGSYPYRLGTHRGLYGAGNPTYNLPVYRDTNHDGHISSAEKAASKRRGDTGSGINIHWGDGYTVGGFSAGCQVVKGSYDYFRGHVTPLLQLNRGQMYYTLIDQSK